MGDTTQTDKTTRWQFTAYEGQYHLFATVFPDIVAEVVWQTEICPKTGKEHYQGLIRTSRQVRFGQLQKLFPGVHIEAARNWDALVNYCKKVETAVPGTQVHIRTETDRPCQKTMAQALTYFAANYPFGISPDKSDWTDKKREAYAEMKFWETVNNCLDNDPNLIGLYHQPQYIRCWKHTASKWFELCLEEAEWSETDRQTDTPLVGYAFV